MGCRLDTYLRLAQIKLILKKGNTVMFSYRTANGDKLEALSAPVLKGEAKHSFITVGKVAG